MGAIPDTVPISLTRADGIAIACSPALAPASPPALTNFRPKRTVVCFLCVISLSLCQNTFHDCYVSRNILQVKNVLRSTDFDTFMQWIRINYVVKYVLFIFRIASFLFLLCIWIYKLLFAGISNVTCKITAQTKSQANGSGERQIFLPQLRVHIKPATTVEVGIKIMSTFANALFLLNIPWKHSTTHIKLLFIKISLNAAQVLVAGNRNITRNILCFYRPIAHTLIFQIIPFYNSLQFIFGVK